MSSKKVVLITGGGTGIGKSISLKFAESGYNVLITYNKSRDEAEETIKNCNNISNNSFAYKTDITKVSEIEKLFDNISKYYGSLTHLVNCAGWTKFINHKDLDKLTEKIFDQVIDVNLKGTFFCIKSAVPLLLKSKYNASIINIASTAGKTGIGSNIAYCASKAGIITMTKSLARALGPNIRVNAIAPGLVETKMTIDWEDYHKDAKKRSPLNKKTTPNDIAKVVISLADEMLLINGDCLIVDSGTFLNN